MNIHFSPAGGCEFYICNLINKAVSEIRVLAYTFTSAPILAALLGKADIPGKVVFIGDRTGMSGVGCRIKDLSTKVECWLDDHHRIAHNKVIIIDRKIVLTGSYNFTKSAEYNNAENLIEIEDPIIAAKYLGNWTLHQQHSTRYDPKLIYDESYNEYIPTELNEE